MKLPRFSVLCLIASALATIHSASGQVINATVQNASPRVVTSRGAPAVKSIANPAIAPHVASRPTSFGPRIVNSHTPYIVGQPGTNLQRNYSPAVRTLNPTFAAPRGGQGQQAINLDPATRETELRTLATMRERRGFGTQQPGTLDPAIRQNELRTLAAMRERRAFGTENRTLASINAQRRVTADETAARPQLDTRESPTDVAKTKWHNRNDRHSYSDASRRHWHEWHDRDWWHNHCDTIVFVTSGYYFLDGRYWYPAWGYDPLQASYDYDGPIYTYGDLLPDEVIANVQLALQDAGYYLGTITGSIDGATRAALANFQRDYDLPITGAIDEPTVETLGLQ
jgi:hypothetical protein